MPILKNEKKILVKKIASEIENAKSLVVATYQGLTVKQLQQLRKEAKAKNVFIKIYKNRLVKKACDSLDLNEINDTLVGANMFAFSNEDTFSAAKILFEFSKKNKEVQLVSGIIEKSFCNKDAILDIAKLPTFEEALTMLATSLQAPIRQIGVGLKMLVDEGHIKE